MQSSPVISTAAARRSGNTRHIAGSGADMEFSSANPVAKHRPMRNDFICSDHCHYTSTTSLRSAHGASSNSVQSRFRRENRDEHEQAHDGLVLLVHVQRAAETECAPGGRRS